MTTLRQRPQQLSATSRGGIVIRLIEKRWLIGSCLVLGWFIGTTVGRLLPRRYRSEIVILIEQQKIPEHIVEPNISGDLQQQRLQSISEQMLSRSRLLALIDKFHLYGSQTGSHDPDELAERMRKDIKIDLIGADGKRGQLAAFQLSYSAPKPLLAREVTNELATQFISETLQDRKQLSEDTTSFLRNQLEEARQSLADQEERVRQFRAQSFGELPEQLQSNLQILAGLQRQLQDSNDSLSQAEQHNLYLRTLYRQYQALGPGAAPGTTPTRSLEAQLIALRAQLAELESHYTDSYPEVIRVKADISRLEAQQASAVSTHSSHVVMPAADDANITPEVGSDSSPMIQLGGELSANGLQIKREKAKIESLEKQIGMYQARLDATPDREEKAAAVNRDYVQSRTYYETLLGKMLQSEMATKLEERRQGEQFRVIDPANLPDRPYWPNQLVCSLVGLAGGLAIGLAIALLLGVVNPRIYQETELAEFIGSGYIMTLPIMATEQERSLAHRNRVLERAAAVILVAIIPTITILSYYIP